MTTNKERKICGNCRYWETSEPYKQEWCRQGWCNAPLPAYIYEIEFLIPIIPFTSERAKNCKLFKEKFVDKRRYL